MGTKSSNPFFNLVQSRIRTKSAGWATAKSRRSLAGFQSCPRKAGFYIWFKNIKVFNGRTNNAKGVALFADSSAFCFIETEKDSAQGAGWVARRSLPDSSKILLWVHRKTLPGSMRIIINSGLRSLLDKCHVYNIYYFILYIFIRREKCL